jgi:hypothetical protein
MIAWLLDRFVYKNKNAHVDFDSMSIAKQLFIACKNCPAAREHVKSAMRAIFECEMETIDDEAAS